MEDLYQNGLRKPSNEYKDVKPSYVLQNGGQDISRQNLADEIMDNSQTLGDN